MAYLKIKFRAVWLRHMSYFSNREVMLHLILDMQDWHADSEIVQFFLGGGVNDLFCYCKAT